MTESKKVYPDPVPDEGQPPYQWWADLRLQSIALAVASTLVKRYGNKYGWTENDITDAILLLGQTVIPGVMAVIGQAKSRSRQEVVKDTINTQQTVIASQQDALAVKEQVIQSLTHDNK